MTNNILWVSTKQLNDSNVSTMVLAGLMQTLNFGGCIRLNSILKLIM
jgi:hypothetical protein